MAAHRKCAQSFIDDVARVLPWLHEQINCSDTLKSADIDVFCSTLRGLARYGDRLTQQWGTPLAAEVTAQVAQLKLQEAALLQRHSQT